MHFVMAFLLGAFAAASASQPRYRTWLATMGGMFILGVGMGVQVFMGLMIGCWMEENQPVLLYQLTTAPRSAALLAIFIAGVCGFAWLLRTVSCPIKPFILAGPLCFVAALLVYKLDVVTDKGPGPITRLSVYMLYSSSAADLGQEREWSSFTDRLHGDVTIGKIDVDAGIDASRLPEVLQGVAQEAASGKVPMFVFAKDWYEYGKTDWSGSSARIITRPMTREEMLGYMLAITRSSM